MKKTQTETASLSSLDVYRTSLEFISALQSQLEKLERSLRQQAQRAAPSIALNLAEALGRLGRDRAHLLSIALGSAREVRAIVDVARATGMMDPATAQDIDSCGDRVCAMLYRLRAGA